MAAPRVEPSQACSCLCFANVFKLRGAHDVYDACDAAKWHARQIWFFFRCRKNILRLKKTGRKRLPADVAHGMQIKQGQDPHTHNIHTHTQSRQKLSKFPKTFCSSLRFCRISVRDKAETRATTTEKMAKHCGKGNPNKANKCARNWLEICKQNNAIGSGNILYGGLLLYCQHALRVYRFIHLLSMRKANKNKILSNFEEQNI